MVEMDTEAMGEAVDSAESHLRKFQRELGSGLTALVLLSILAAATEDLYGYEIARRLAAVGGQPGPFKQGTLYPVLRNLSASGLLTSRVVPSYAGPARRYYRITPLGRDVLAQWTSAWQGTRDFVDAVVRSHASREIRS